MSNISSYDIMYSFLYYVAEALDSASLGNTKVCFYSVVDRNKDYNYSDNLPFACIDIGRQTTEPLELGSIQNIRSRTLGVWVGARHTLELRNIEDAINNYLDSNLITLYDITNGGHKYTYTGSSPFIGVSTLVGNPNGSFNPTASKLGDMKITGSIDIGVPIIDEDSSSDFGLYITFKVELPIV